MALNVSRDGVRRFLLDAQDLTDDHHYAPERTATPASVLKQIRRLEAVQLDPVSAVERNQHLVLAARVSGYAPSLLERLLTQKQIFEYWGHAACVFPMEDYPIFEGKRRRDRARMASDIDEITRAVRAVLGELRRRGPLPARAFASGERMRGWWDIRGPRTKTTSHALNLLWYTGRVMVVRRDGLERSFDLPERAVPAAVLRRAREIDPAEADDALLLKYMRAHRVFDLGEWAFGWRKISIAQRRTAVANLVRAGTVVPLAVDGSRRPYFILAEDEDRLRRHARASRESAPGEGPIRFLSPLDNLLWRRERLADCFGFDYTWEVYVPAAKRRYGYYTMPVLAGGRLIGRMDPRLDRDRHRLIVNFLHLEPRVAVTRRLREALHAALDGFARFHGVSEVVAARTRPAALLR